MNMWHILGIERTNDISLIKKAYAAKLKIHHPEDDPMGFQKLREAFDNARKYAQRNRVNRPEASYESAPPEENNLNSESDISNESSIVDFTGPELTPITSNIPELPKISIPSIEDLNDEFMGKVVDLYKDLSCRLDIEKWKLILDSDILWNISNKEILSKKLLGFIMSHHYLPQGVWKILDLNFNWSKQAEYLASIFPEAFIDYVYRRITEASALNYSYSEALNAINYENYFMYRQKAHDAMLDKKLGTALEYIQQAKEIFPGDLDLVKLEGDYYFRVFDMQKALIAYNLLLESFPDDVEYLKYRAKINYRLENFHEAAEDYKKLRLLKSNDLEDTLLLGKCYIKSGDLENAKKYFQKVLDSKPLHREAKTCLIEVNRGLIKNLRTRQRKKEDKIAAAKLILVLEQELAGLENKKQKKRQKFKLTTANTFLLLFLAFIAIFFVFKSLGWVQEDAQPEAAVDGKIVVKDNSYTDISTDRTSKTQLTFSNVKPLSIFSLKDEKSDDTIKSSTISYDDDNFLNFTHLIAGHYFLGELDGKVVVIFNSGANFFNFVTLESFTAFVTLKESPPADLINKLKEDALDMYPDYYNSGYFEKLDTSRYYIGQWDYVTVSDSNPTKAEAAEDSNKVDSRVALGAFILIIAIVAGYLIYYMSSKKRIRNMFSK